VLKLKRRRRSDSPKKKKHQKKNKTYAVVLEVKTVNW
jgi:hypothetical protein